MWFSLNFSRRLVTVLVESEVSLAISSTYILGFDNKDFMILKSELYIFIDIAL